MSATDEVVSLKAQLKETESKWKITQDKLKEEHAQLINFQKKLAQAGSHLKTLAGENASLTKQLGQEKNEKLILAKEKQELESIRHDETRTWSAEVEQLKLDLEKSKEGHKREILQLVDLLETTTAVKEEEERKHVPDVSTSTLLDSYIKSVQKKLTTKAVKNTQDDLELTIKQLKQEIHDIKSIDHVELIATSLQNILQDPENCTINNSIPPSLLLLLEQVRSTLQEQQENIAKAIKSNQSQDIQQDLKRQITQLNITINELTEDKERFILEKEEKASQLEQVASLQKELTDVQNQLIDCEKQKQASQDREKQLSKEHQSLLGKLHHFKETLTPRLEQDKQLRQKVSKLTQELDITTQELERSRMDMMMRDEETSNQIQKHEYTISQLSTRLENVQREREEYEIMAMQLDAQCNQIQDQLEASNSELEKLKETIAIDQMKHESERSSLANLQTVLEEFQATKDAEMQAAVEHIERQLSVAKKSWKEYEERAHAAETCLEKYQHDVGKTQQYEKDIKEKNLLIGKLRHEAIILNEHLVEAMRKLKEETSENNVDRQLITNLLVGFFLAPRGDRKRFDILTIIANVLQLNEEQKEQIGLTRPKGSSLVNRTAVAPVSMTEQPQKESFTDAWISFLLKESSPLRRNRSAITLSQTNLDDNVEL